LVKKNFRHASGILLIDAKHVPVGGQDYCEYLAFDTKLRLIGRCHRKGGESTWGYREIFKQLQTAGYVIRAVVSDGGTGIYSALRAFGIKRHQRCHIHLLRDLKTGLRIHAKRPRIVLRKYYCVRYAKLLLAASDESLLELRLRHFERIVFTMWPAWGDVEMNAIRSFLNTLPQAFTFLQYQKLWDIPKTTNALEGYISHLNARLKTMRGLKSPANAGRILNAIHYFLRKKL
jgi:transposase-like protein